MAVQPTNLFAPTLLTGSAATFYTVPSTPAGVVLYQGRVRFTNTDSASHAVTMYAIPSGGTASATTECLPAYSIALGLIALLGYMAIASGVKSMPAYAAGFKTFGPNFAVPALFLHSFPSWFVGVAFASIAIGALVPAAIMSIACANLFTRSIYREYIRKDCTPAHESQVAKITSLVVKFGAVVFILALPKTYAINLQLLGGIWIIQTLPAVLIGLYTRALNPWALLIGWASGIAVGKLGTATVTLVELQASFR